MTRATSHAKPASPVRIAAVQHGDYREALAVIGAGKAEPYFGMSYSLETLAALFAGREHLVISLDAPAHDERRGQGRLVGLPAPRVRRPLPGLVGMLAWGRRVRAHLEAFRPTHLLLRTGNPFLAVPALGWCRRAGASALVIMAGVMSPGRGLGWPRAQRRLVELLNDPCVFLVGNHKRIATESLVRCGVNADKAVAWDWPGLRHPRDCAPKTLPAPGGTGVPPVRLRAGVSPEFRPAPETPQTPVTSSPLEVVYVGSVTRAKGVEDLVRAADVYARRGKPIALSIYGAGADLDSIRALASQSAVTVRVMGQVGNAEAFEAMRRAAVVCVPTRHEFSEGMPLTLTESLAARTPVVCSDHPVFTAAFRDGEGLVFHKAADPASIADAIARILSDPRGYARLSESTAAAYERVECRTMFGDLIDRWTRATMTPAAPGVAA